MKAAHIRRGIVLVSILCALTMTGVAQQLRFDVASVKPSPDTLDVLASLPRQAGGRLFLSGPLRSLISRAYGIENSQIVGGPSLMSRNFDIVAKAENPDATPAQMNQMLKSMLIERFQLRAHPEMREADIRVLRLADSNGALGPRLKRSSLSCPTIEELVAAVEASAGSTPGDRLTAALPKPGDPCERSPQELAAGRQKGQAISTLVVMLGLLGGPRVQDRTGLTGRYDWDLTFDPRPLSAAPNAPSPTGPPLLAAIEQQLGLKVESAKGTAEFLVIDSVEAPTPD